MDIPIVYNLTVSAKLAESTSVLAGDRRRRQEKRKK